MKIILAKSFIRDFTKLDAKIQKQFLARRDLFLVDPFHRLLNNHALKAQFIGFRSFNVTGDFRVIFSEPNDGQTLFIRIGTHSQLYGK